MQRSSERIGTLAAALARAQCQITNPDKSLTATIVSPFPREGNRTFRYASLSAGLDLVRKCLGQHEIATVQTTAIEKDSGLICLTTTLVHASGEWVSSDWPVCPVSETAAPHRLGAALTYARRYALFTLVGIAGEDDVDAPDVAIDPAPSARQSGSHEGTRVPVTTLALSRPPQATERRSRTQAQKLASLSHEDSEDLRCKLIFELSQMREPEALATWAHRTLPIKNKLSIADAEKVEAAFEATLSKLSVPTQAERPEQLMLGEPPLTELGITVVPIPKPERERDRHHLRFVASQPCLVCGRTPTDAHHVKFAEQWTAGRKVSDKFTVPLCRLHHRELHRRGNERIWWQKLEIEPLNAAAALWASTHKVEDPQRAIDAPGPIASIHLQNDETKPIAPSEIG